MLRGVLYWLKMSSLSFVARMYDLDFTPVRGPTLGPPLSELAKQLEMLAGVTLIITLWLQWRFFRTAWRKSMARPRGECRPCTDVGDPHRRSPRQCSPICTSSPSAPAPRRNDTDVS